MKRKNNALASTKYEKLRKCQERVMVEDNQIQDAPGSSVMNKHS